MSLYDAYRAERRAFLETLRSLTEAELEKGETLCAGWAPRDVLAHLLGTDALLPEYVKALGSIRKGNAAIVARYRDKSTAELLELAEHWAARPAVTSRVAAPFLLGDLAIHHQDVLRPLGRTREVPPVISGAILREGLVLGGFLKLRDHRLVPTDHGRPLGRGAEVRGTREALGMWLAGRRSVAPELSFGG